MHDFSNLDIRFDRGNSLLVARDTKPLQHSVNVETNTLITLRALRR
jgi:hypothetical protein